MVVLILGDPDREDEHELVRRAVRERGGEARVVNVFDWAEISPVSYDIDENQFALNEPIPMDEVTGAYVMEDLFVDTAAPMIYDLFQEKENVTAYNQVREWHALLRSVLARLRASGANVVLAPPDTRWDDVRPWMLTAFEEHNVPIPVTTFTNEPAVVRSFLSRHSPAVVHHVNGGRRPVLLRESEVSDEMLGKLSESPVKLQEYVPGDDIRAFVLEDEVIATIRKDTKTLDSTADSDGSGMRWPRNGKRMKEFTPPPDLERLIRRAAGLTPSPFVAVDLRRKESGDFVVLESNTSGKFAPWEKGTRAEISGAVAAYLTGEQEGDAA